MAYIYKHGDRPLDDFTIQRAVGSGGFGEVYYAISDGGREVALKYLRENPQTELRGVSHCINLKSPHLVSIFDIKKNADGDYFIIMEYCSGPSLRDLLIAEPEGLGEQKAAFFVREIAKGLSYLHDRGIVHRDLKPGNIFYDDGYVKICDYGLSKFISVSRHSAQTASVGTVHYMAPEIGSGNYSRGVDIYALGVILYEMLLGRLPFEGSSMGEILMKHLTNQPEVDHLPHPFGKVIRKAMEKDPRDRYQTADEMVEDLLEVQVVKDSLAGFSPQSLGGAVYRAPHDSPPMPSPNPAPAFAPDLRQPGIPKREELPPFAVPLPDKLGRRAERISRKIDRKMRALQHKDKAHGRERVPPPVGPPGVGPKDGASPDAPGEVLSPRERRKRRLVACATALCIAGGACIASAAVYHQEEAAGAAFLLVCTMSMGIMLSRRVLPWLGEQPQPDWVQRFVRLVCCTPLVFIGCAPFFENRALEGFGLTVAVGMLSTAFLANWSKDFVRGSDGELSIWLAIWTGCGAFLAVAITGAFMGNTAFGSVYRYSPAGAAPFAFIVGTAVSLIIQTTSWWLPARVPAYAGGWGRAHGKGRRHHEPSPGPRDDRATRETEEAPSPPFAHSIESETPVPEPRDRDATTAANDRHDGPVMRWGITRAFWSLAAFMFISAATILGLAPIMISNMAHGKTTALIVSSIGCAAAALFALPKTTIVKRQGFWRETMRPLLISASLFGIGACATQAVRDWRCCNYDQQTFLVMTAGASITVLLASLLCGRRRRPAQPFLVQADSTTEAPENQSSG